jgi:heat shock protein HspQ
VDTPDPIRTCAFEPGQIVDHRLYDYRGVVVAVDATCQADDEWYQRNRTQPDRNQPWYHVLVDGDPRTTYVAEENLTLSDNDREIQHPLVKRFFTLFLHGRYYRGISLN